MPEYDFEDNMRGNNVPINRNVPGALNGNIINNNNNNNINNNGKPFLRSQIPPGKYRKQIMVYNGPSFTVYKGGTTPIEITSGTKLGWNGKSWQVPNEGVVMNPKTGVTMFFNGEMGYFDTCLGRC